MPQFPHLAPGAARAQYPTTIETFFIQSHTLTRPFTFCTVLASFSMVAADGNCSPVRLSHWEIFSVSKSQALTRSVSLGTFCASFSIDSVGGNCSPTVSSH